MTRHGTPMYTSGTATLFVTVTLFHWTYPRTLRPCPSQAVNLYFYPVRSANYRGYIIYWYTIAIAPTTKIIPLFLSTERKSKMKSLLLQHFWVLLFKAILWTFFSDFPVDKSFLFPPVEMLVAYQPDERAVLCLKGRDSYMDCSLRNLLLGYRRLDAPLVDLHSRSCLPTMITMSIQSIQTSHL